MEQAFHVTPLLAQLHSRSVGTVTVRDGRELTVTLVPGADEGPLPECVINTALPLLLYQRGYLVLRASAVVVQGLAVVFAAGDGGGKSTLAASLYQQGHGLLADDVTAIDMGCRRPAVIPAAPLLRLDGRTASHVGLPQHPLPGAEGRAGKGLTLVERRFAAGPVPLGVIYYLRPGADNNIGYVPLQTALMSIVYHSYPACLMQPSSVEYLRLWSRLAGIVPVCAFTRRCTLSDLVEQMQMVESHLADRQAATSERG
jgi:hypothetical protein